MKELINFIFYVDPDHISKNVVLCSLHFTVDLFTNKAQFNAGFSERLKPKRKCCVDYIESDSNVTTRKSVCIT